MKTNTLMRLKLKCMCKKKDDGHGVQCNYKWPRNYTTDRLSHNWLSLFC